MIAAVAALFTTAIPLSGVQRFLMLLPLCLSIAVVYKTTRCDDLREVPVAALTLWVTIVAGMCIVGFVLWATFMIMV